MSINFSPSKSQIRVFLSAVIISAFLSLFLYIFFIQSPLLSKREFLFTLLIWVFLSPLLYILLSRFLLPNLQEYTPRAQRYWLLLSIGVGIFFALVTHPPQVILLFPKHTLQVLIPAGPADRSVTLEFATTSLSGNISFSQFSTTGNWQRTDTGFTLSGSEPASLSWTRRSGASAQLVFTDSPALKGVQLGWDGDLAPLDEIKAAKGQVAQNTLFSTGWQTDLTARIIFGFTIGFLCLVLSLLLAGVHLKTARPVTHKKGYWLLYTLPMIAIWGIYLLTFFPGMMSKDSIDQWTQLINGQFNNYHPVFHTLVMWLITRLWFSPAAVAIFQILCLSFTVAWGISILDGQGIPRWAAWLISALFAIVPINGNMVIVLWKDILYSTSLLLLSIILLKIIFSSGSWLKHRFHWLWLGLVCALVACFRHNGFPIAFLTLIILLILYRKWLKYLGGSLILLLFVWYSFQGPILDLLHAEKPVGAEMDIYIHHIAAHIFNGGPLTQEQQEIANLLAPEGQWVYDCCSALKNHRMEGYSNAHNEIDYKKIRDLALQLALKEPGVEIAHQLCISSIVWEIPNHCVNRGFLPYANLTWISTNDLKIKGNSLLPGLVLRINKIVINMKNNPNINGLLSPSIYLFLIIFICLFTAIKLNFPKVILFSLPALFQSALLAIINISDNFRYQYGVYLIGLFSLGLLFYAISSPRIKQPVLDPSIPVEN